MIITRIIGGLGNQLFQYAAGKSLALHRQTELFLDVESFKDYKLRNLDLSAFQTDLHFSTPEQNQHFLNRSLVGKIRDNIFPMSLRKVYKPKHFHFHKRFFSASSDVYIQGYWHSEKYFSSIRDVLLNEFSLKEEYYSRVVSLASEIKKENSISVHIRRGDYQNEAVKKVHGILPLEYYKKAIAALTEKERDCRFYFFSDDMNWVRENLNLKNAVYVSGILSHTHFEDFYLMSQCKHNIIANSSFSWWGAWLNNNPDKIVIGPKKWFDQGPKDTQDILPKEWISL